ncbi:hypothetical protein V6N12_040271 [Hibiscus sabdariffa]|uniref:RNase H type-1 domain-containing protein n=1 Tax=Hibiscus sabdariffa TaxID=183260 RepID=A0ABR2E374_9ROSI
MWLDWPQKFAILCWLLWKNRCCRVMGGECMHREELLVRGNLRMILGQSDVCMGHALVVAIRSLLCRDWQLSISHVPHGCNACVDRLTALGRGQVVEVLEFEASPAELLDLVDEEAASSG